MQAEPQRGVKLVAHVPAGVLEALLEGYGLELRVHADGQPIPGSYWGEPEAGLTGCIVHVRADTPLHSLLHEACHTVCMSGERRGQLVRDAGGDDLEEAAVCYLQIVLADALPGVGRDSLMRDMDVWGYSFRLGSTARWFAEDATDASAWLEEQGLLAAGRPTFSLRR